MPVNNTSSLAGPFIPNGTTTIFPFAFNAQQVSDVAVYDGDGATVSSALYTVALYEGDGGTVTFGTAPTSAQFAQLYIALVPSFAQTADFTNAGPTYNPAQLTAALDAISTRIIALKAEVDRSLKVRRGDGVELMPADRAGKFLAFDAGGNPVATSGTGVDGALRSDLAASGGAALAGFSQSGTGSVPRTVQDKLRESRSLEDQGAVGNNTANDAVNANLALTAEAGGEVRALKRYFLGSTTLSIPAETTLSGAGANPEQVVVGTGSYYDRDSMIRSAASTAVSIGRGGSLENMTLTRSGLTMPWSTNTQAANNIAAFSGTGVDVSETGATVEGSMLIGWGTAIAGTYASDEGRARIMFNKVDSTNGVNLNGARDLNIVGFNHFWPFASAHTSGLANANLKRSGAAMTFSGAFNEASVSICNFEYGYAQGMVVAGPNINSICDQFDDIDGAAKVAYAVTGDGYFKILGGSAIVLQDGVTINAGTSNTPAVNSVAKWWQASRFAFDAVNGDFSSVADIVEGRGAPNVSVGYNIRATADNFAIVAPQTGSLNEVLKIAPGWTGFGLFIPGMSYAGNTTWIAAAQAELNRVTILNGSPQNGLTNQLLRPLRINMAGTPEIELYRSDGGADSKRASIFFDGTSIVIRLKNDADNAVVRTAIAFNMSTGRVSLPNLPGSTSYANDAAAAVGGVAVGELYRNGSAVQVRVT